MKSSKLKELTQDKLDKIIKLHKIWLDTEDKGKQANFTNLELNNLDLSKTVLNYAVFNNTVLNNVKASNTLFKYCDFNNVEFNRCDFNVSNFRYSKLDKIKANHSDFTASDFRNACWMNSKIKNCDMSYSKYNSSPPDFEVFDERFIKGVPLKTELNSCNFYNCLFDGSDFSDILIENTRFNNSLMTNIIGIDAVQFSFSRDKNNIITLLAQDKDESKWTWYWKDMNGISTEKCKKLAENSNNKVLCKVIKPMLKVMRIRRLMKEKE